MADNDTPKVAPSLVAAMLSEKNVDADFLAAFEKAVAEGEIKPAVDPGIAEDTEKQELDML